MDVVREGASVGARVVCVAPATIGRWAMVAAGAVVTADVSDFALVAGVPARRIRWVGRAGEPLEDRGDGTHVCPRTGEVVGEIEDATGVRIDHVARLEGAFYRELTDTVDGNVLDVEGSFARYLAKLSLPCRCVHRAETVLAGKWASPVQTTHATTRP